MRQFIAGLSLLACLVGVPAQSNSVCSEKEKADNTKEKDVDPYKAPKPAPTSTGTGQQENSQASTKAAAQAGVNAANQCLSEVAALQGKVQSDKEALDANTKCTEKDKEKNKQAKKILDQHQAQCQAALDKAQSILDKSGDNQKGMEGKNDQAKGGGDDKKDDKGGGGGGAPQAPQMPQQKDKKKDDSAQKEAERQQRIAECKVNVASMLETRKKNCESKFPFDPAHPVQDMKDKQESCKQDAIFQSQAEMSQCELNNPPGGLPTGPGSTISK